MTQHPIGGAYRTRLFNGKTTRASASSLAHVHIDDHYRSSAAPDIQQSAAMANHSFSLMLLLIAATNATILVISPSLYSSSTSPAAVNSAEYVELGMGDLAASLTHVTDADLSAIPHQQLLALASNFLTNPEVDVTAEGVKSAATNFQNANDIDAGDLKHRLSNEIKTFLEAYDMVQE